MMPPKKPSKKSHVSDVVKKIPSRTKPSVLQTRTSISSTGKSSLTKIPKRTDLVSLEIDALARSNRILNAVEKFLARWDSIKAKPSNLTSRVIRLKKFQEELANWQKNVLKAKSKSDDSARNKRLQDFVSICQNYYEVSQQ